MFGGFNYRAEASVEESAPVNWRCMKGPASLKLEVTFGAVMPVSD